LDLCFLNIPQNVQEICDPIAAGRGLARFLTEADRREQFETVKAESATFGELANVLNNRRVRGPGGRPWTPASAARFALTQA
jgi:hypothetical protein